MPCPHCGQNILPDAKRCQHCGEWLDDDAKNGLRHLIVQQSGTATTALIKCPFCAEAIQPDAKKCRFCGEWLGEAENRPGTSGSERGSADARAVAKGIKQQELDKSIYNGCGCLSLIGGIGIGSAIGSGAGVFIGTFVFIMGMFAAWIMYQKE